MEVEEKFTRPGFLNLIPKPGEYTKFSRTESFFIEPRLISTCKSGSLPVHLEFTCDLHLISLGADYT